MNLLEAEKLLREFDPHISYLAHSTVNREKESEKRFMEYLNLKTRIFETKDRYYLAPLEFSLGCLEDEKLFYGVFMLPMLYKEHVSEESLKYCKKKLKEIDAEIEELKGIIKHRKKLATL